ncbi:MAG: copper chaperone PCu(A)C [Caldilineaceae bacterium]|nr:copper chaperone PCu(A)C [Caldilineaceae bacterium]
MRYALRFVVGSLLFTLVLSGCFAIPSAPAQMGAEQAATVPAPEPGKVTVVDARSRAVPPTAQTGAAFLTVLNGLEQPIRLTAAASDVAESVELHETVDENGVMKMIPHPEGFEIPAGGALELKPGAKHVMLIGLQQQLSAGDSFVLTLTFDLADPVTLTVPVMAIGDTMMSEQMDHGAMEDHGEGTMATPAAP